MPVSATDLLIIQFLESVDGVGKQMGKSQHYRLKNRCLDLVDSLKMYDLVRVRVRG